MSSNEPRLDVRRVIIVWLVLSVVAVLAIWFGLGPHMPPGSATAQAHEQREANLILSLVLAPIAVRLPVSFGFVLTPCPAATTWPTCGPTSRARSRSDAQSCAASGTARCTLPAWC